MNWKFIGNYDLEEVYDEQDQREHENYWYFKLRDYDIKEVFVHIGWVNDKQTYCGTSIYIVDRYDIPNVPGMSHPYTIPVYIHTVLFTNIYFYWWKLNNNGTPEDNFRFYLFNKFIDNRTVRFSIYYRIY